MASPLGKMPTTISAPLDLTVEALEPIDRVDFRSVIVLHEGRADEGGNDTPYPAPGMRQHPSGKS
jgi:hypothetical protein